MSHEKPPVRCIVRPFPFATIQVFRKVDFDPAVGAIAGPFSIIVDLLNRPITDKAEAARIYDGDAGRIIEAFRDNHDLDPGDMFCLIMTDVILRTGVFIEPGTLMSPGYHVNCWLEAWHAQPKAVFAEVLREFNDSHPQSFLQGEIREHEKMLEAQRPRPLYEFVSMN
jgi:hypothetical protein